MRKIDQYRSASTLHKIIDRGATSSLISAKPDLITPYFNQIEAFDYADDGAMVGHSKSDTFNR